MISAIAIGIAFPVACISEESRMGSSQFRFEDFESDDLDMDAQRAEEALGHKFPMGSDVAIVKELLVDLGARCHTNPSKPGEIYCRYGHTIWITERFPPFPILQEWITTIFYNAQTTQITKYEVTVGLTGP